MFADIGFNSWRRIRKGAYSAGDLARFHSLGRMLEAFNVALHFGIPVEQLQTKGRWLSVHPMGTAHFYSVFIFLGFFADDIFQMFKIFFENVVGLLQQITICRVNNVGAGEPIVNPFLFFAEGFRNCSRESNDIVTRLLFDLVDAIHIKTRVLAQRHAVFFWHNTEF